MIMEEKEDNLLSGVKEIARRAKVSRATVDRVIHNRPGVSKKTKATIVAGVITIILAVLIVGYGNYLKP